MNSNLTKVIAHENKRCSIALDKSPSSENWNELKRQPNIGDETIFLQQTLPFPVIICLIFLIGFVC